MIGPFTNNFVRSERGAGVHAPAWSHVSARHGSRYERDPAMVMAGATAATPCI